MTERLVIVIEYDVHGDMQQAVTEVMSRISEGRDWGDPDHVKVVGVHVGVKDFVDRVLDLFAKDSGTPDNPPSEPAEAAAAAPGTPGHPDAAAAQQERRALYRGAVAADLLGQRRALYMGAVFRVAPWATSHGEQDAIANAVMRVADAEQADLQAMAADNTRLFELASAQREALRVVNIHLQHERDEARATNERVRALADNLEANLGRRIGWISAPQLRAALDAPTEPAPGLEVRRDAPSPLPPEEIALWPKDGSGMWVGNAVDGPAHDPPSSLKPDLIDPLPAVKARLDKAMKAQERT